MRIVRIITRLNIGGPSLQAAGLTRDLAAAGHETTLIHGRLGATEGTMQDLLPRDAANVIYLDSMQREIAPVADARAFAAILQMLRRIEPHIVHTHMAKAGLLGRAAAIAYNGLRGRAHRARIVHTYHGHVLEGYFRPAVAGAFVRVERMLARGTDALVAISPRIGDELVDRFRIAPRGKFTVIPLGFDLAGLAALNDADRAAARRHLGVDARARVVTTVGRLTAIKHHELFLRSAALIAQQLPNAVFLVAGDGELRQPLEALAKSLGIGNRVTWLGWRRDLETVYGASDLFVLSSINEGTPVALIEAMAAGVPGVATDVGGVRDVILDERTGIVVRADAAAIADAAVTILKNEESRKAMGMRARASVLGRYDVKRLVADIEAFYETLVR